MSTLHKNQGHDLKFAAVNTAVSGNTTVQAAVAGKKIRVCSYVLVATGAVTVQWLSTNTTLSGAMSLAANGGVAAIGEPSAVQFETPAGEALILALGGAVQVSGHIAYTVDPS